MMCLADDASAAKKTYITIGTASTGGTFYIIGGGVANLLNKYLPNVEAVAKVTPGSSAENIPALTKKRIELAFNTSDQAYYGYHGGAMYKEAYPDIRIVMSTYSGPLHFIVLAKSGITSCKQLEGKKIAMGARGSTQEKMALAVLDAYGVKEYNPYRLTIAETINALRDGTVDAGNPPAGVPIASVMDLASTHDIRILPIEEEPLAKILKENPYWSREVIPANSYRGQTEDVPSFAYYTVITTHKDVDEDLLYNITKLLIEKNDELAKVHPVGKHFNLQNATKGVVTPFHPGAKRYFAEHGIETP
jgi:TRAP transporter TAXI family solute receptor